MNEKTHDQLHRMYEVFDEDHQRLRDELMASLPELGIQTGAVGNTKIGWQLFGDNKMKRRILVTLAIAACLVLIVLGFWPGPNDNGRVYGMSDVPELLKKAKTLHIRGWAFLPDRKNPDKEPGKLPFEEWFDMENSRLWLHKPGGFRGPNNDKPYYFDTVSDGRYTMKTIYNNKLGGEITKMVRYTRLTPFQSRLQAYQAANVFIVQMFGNLDQVAGFTNSGEDVLNGTHYNLWQGEVSWPDGRMHTIKSWLSPTTGKLGRVLVQYKDKNDAPSHFMMDIDLIERDVVPPPHIFKTEPPADCTPENSKENAPLSELGGEIHMSEKYALKINIGFTMKDGTVIIGWNSPDKTAISQSDIFKDCDLGGSLPKLPAQITGLTPVPQSGDIHYIGYHLAFTRKDNRFYEWSIYVPDKIAPARGSILAYDLRVIYNKDKSKFGSWATQLAEDLIIETSEDFDKWILGAMAELSDGGVVPENLTYDSVMALSAKLRGELAQK